MKKLLLASIAFASLSFLRADESDLSPANIFEAGFDDHFEELQRQCEPLPDAIDIVETLNTLGLPTLLQNNFYKHTNPINTRPLVDLPSFQMAYFQLPFVPCQSGVSVQFFFNQMRDCYFTKCSSKISSYLNLNDANLLESIDLDDLLDTSLDTIFPLFANMKLEERRAGIMLGGYKNFGKSWFNAILPFYWLEHNFFLTQKEQEAIQNQPLFINAGAGTDVSGEMEFAYKHLVSTKLGLGDLRLQLARNLTIDSCSTLLPTFEVTLPTSRALDGRRIYEWFGDSVLIGGRYCKMCCPPPLDFQELACLAFGTVQQQAEAKTLATNFLVGALDRLTANVADRSLGQEHTSLGPVVYYYRQLSEYAAVQANLGFDYFIPRPETRFFLFNKNPEEFNRDYTNPADATANLAFLTQQTVNFLYPGVCNVRVHPGIVTKFSVAFWYNSPSFRALVGYDYWHKTKEYVTIPYATTLLLNIARGLRPEAYQSKIFAKVFAYMPGFCEYLYAGLSGDFTVDSYGIGRDFTLSVDLVFRY